MVAAECEHTCKRGFQRGGQFVELTLRLICSVPVVRDIRIALLRQVGFQKQAGRDFLYAFNILATHGLKPEVAYINSVRMDYFETFDEALLSLSDILTQALVGLATDGELAAIPSRLRPWLEANLILDENGYHLAEDRKVIWAFLAWTPQDLR